MKDKDKAPLSERLCRALEIPIDALPHRTLVELYGRSGARICGGGAILLYSPHEIRVAMPDREGYVSVKGRGLTCSSYNMGAVGIEGRICSVDFGESDDE